MYYYPVNLNLKDKLCLVVGGGKVAERKIKTLLQFGALVKVVALKAVAEIKALSRAGKLVLKEGAFSPSDLEGIFIVIAATNDSKTNQEIASEAKRKHILVNVVDNPQLSDFIFPSVLQRGDLLISICSGGKAPALSKRLRLELEKVLPQDFAELLDKAGIWRENLKAKIKDLSQRKHKLEDLWQC
jgi:siroheme synthase-like protein